MSQLLYENLDLKRERRNCHFNKEEITNLIDGGIEKTKYRRELGNLFYMLARISCFYHQIIVLPGSNSFFFLEVEYILSYEELKDPIPIEYLSHEERYAAELKKSCLLVQKLRNPVPSDGSEILRYTLINVENILKVTY